MKTGMQKYKDTGFTIAILILAFLVGFEIEKIWGTPSLVPAMFTLGVFLISLYTDGYVYGIVASLLSMLVVNFAFTYPYFRINFWIPENLISAIIMLIITVMTSALTTKLKKQEQLRIETEREKMRANLLRAVSHDLRTPLTTIYGSGSALVENFDELSDEQKLELVNGMREDAQWMVGMVENLLSVTRMENGNVKLHKTPVVLEELIDSVLLRFKKRYPRQEVVVEIPEEFISIPMDTVLITQVLVNMLENAVQHATGMTELILRVFTEQDKAVFEILDDGCGISKHQMEHIFTGYFENKELPADNQRNMGIGLSVCASVVNAHGGRIEVENRRPKGCIFRFALQMEEKSHG